MHINDIYPSELELKETTESSHIAFYLGLLTDIKDRHCSSR